MRSLKFFRPGLLLPAAPGFLLGWYFDLLPLRLEALGLPVPAGAGLVSLHLLSGLCTAVLCAVLARCFLAERETFRVPWKPMAALFLLVNGLTALYIFTSRTVYYWDTAGYWSVARRLAAEHLGRTQLRGVLRSVVTEEYNQLLAFPVSLVMRLLGESRAVFVFSIANLYTLPALWGLTALWRERPWGGLLLGGLLPMLLYMGCIGFVDTAACAAAIWALVLFRQGAGRRSAGVLAGFFLCLSFLLRRYFFFYACAFCLAAAAEWLLLDRKREGFLRLLGLYVPFALCCAYFASNFIVSQALLGGLGDLYSAYSLSPRYDLLLTCRYFGLAGLLVLLVLAVRGLLRGKNREDLVFALCQGAACYTAFVLVQTHGQQHLLMYVPALALLVRSAAGESKRLLPLCAAAMTLWCLVPKAQPGSIQAIPYPAPIPSFTFYGQRRGDIEELLALGRYVDGLSAEEPKTAAVLSSSLSFNPETLANLWVSLSLPRPRPSTALVYQGSVDKVDPMNWRVLEADYLILGDPVQTHLGEENQLVVVLPAREVLEGAGLGRAYEPLPETFRLQDGITVRIFRRTREVTREEKEALSARLLERYPEYESLYSLPD